MSSPCPPRSRAETSSIEQPISQAMNVRKRATSRLPAWPTMRLVGNPDAFHAAVDAVYVATATDRHAAALSAAVAAGRPAVVARGQLPPQALHLEQVAKQLARLQGGESRQQDDVVVSVTWHVGCPRGMGRQLGRAGAHLNPILGSPAGINHRATEH